MYKSYVKLIIIFHRSAEHFHDNNLWYLTRALLSSFEIDIPIIFILSRQIEKIVSVKQNGSFGHWTHVPTMFIE